MPKIVTANRAAISDIRATLLRAPNLLASLGLDDVGLEELEGLRLGEGHYAYAFMTPHGTVLKVTDDEDDARVCKLILDHGNGKPGLPYIKSVHKLPGEVYENETDVSEQRPLFAIVMEAVVPASKSGVMPPGTRPRLLGEAILGGPHALSDEDYESLSGAAIDLVSTIGKGIDWLSTHGVEVLDLHHNNFGYASGNRPVIIDFGHGSLRDEFEMRPVEMATNPGSRADIHRMIIRPEGGNATSDEAYDTFTMMRKQNPDSAWRGMEEAEYENTVGAGQGVRSRGDYSFSIEGTQFSDDPGDGEAYANAGRSDPRRTGRPTYLVEVSRAGLSRKRDGYLETGRGEGLPQERVKRVWRFTARDGAIVASRVGDDSLVQNGRRRSTMPKVCAAFDECFDALKEQFPDFGKLELHHDEKAGGDNGHGSERQFGYCMDSKPIRVAFAAKTEDLPVANIRGLMAHEFGHALDYRYGDKLGKMLGQRLPKGVERRADSIAKAVFGRTIKYDDRDIQCVACEGKSVRPRRLGP